MRKRDNEKKDAYQNVVQVARVTRVVAGGKRMRFRALVVVGDKKGSVGMGVKKGADVSEAVNKAATSARKSFVRVNITRGTIPHRVQYKYKASVILLKPAPAGTGIIAGGPIRAVIEGAGITDIVSKMLGSANKINNVHATLLALASLKRADQRRGYQENK
jgi:small subunit ribosomal protein S5